MVAICAGLGGAQERPSCEPRLAVANAEPGTSWPEVRSSLKPDVACLRVFRKILSMGQDKPFI